MPTRVIAGLLLLFLMWACGPTPIDVRKLERHQSAWAALGIRSYTFRYRLDCFCPYSHTLWRIEVRNGRPVRADPLDPVPSGTLNPMPTGEHFTIDSLFASVADAYARGADRVDVEYHDRYHYPMKISIDWVFHAIDDEIHLMAEGLAPDSAR